MSLLCWKSWENPDPWHLGYALKHFFSRRENNPRQMSRLVCYYCFPKPEGTCHCGSKQKYFAVFPLFDAFLLNIRKTFMKCNLIHLLKINTEVDFHLINLLSKKGSREILVNV